MCARVVSRALGKSCGNGYASVPVSRGDSAPLGAKPYGMVTRRVELTGRVVELDAQARRAVVEGKHGAVVLSVAADVDLSNIRVSDTVRVDYLERLTISVDARQ